MTHTDERRFLGVLNQLYRVEATSSEGLGFVVPLQNSGAFCLWFATMRKGWPKRNKFCAGKNLESPGLDRSTTEKIEE